jgi:uncharacterized linocin/CFP29 family protein
MDILKRELAPISPEAWEEIDKQAAKSLGTVLTARRVVDVLGPYGIDYGAAPTGRIDVEESGDGVGYGIHRVQPLLEARAHFKLSRWELDNITRGNRDPDLSELDKAVWKIARFEEETIYKGRSAASIDGLETVAIHNPVPYNDDPEEFLRAAAKGMTELRNAMIEGPYALVVTEEVWNYITSAVQGRPLKHHLEYILQGPVIYSSFVSRPLLVSMRGGDLELIIGQDLSIGYHHHDTETVELYLTESFTFRVLDPQAMLFFKH